ncbi:NAD(P)-binding protein [Stenotrophomonas maltophilia]|uniref:NAD(P)-binding protein n=1 Tax=Stenotrophomonas maltophilia TaxID=40324 RepID=UPI003D2F539C
MRCACNPSAITSWLWHRAATEGPLSGESVSRIHVSIIGAGLGGLALAQALKRGGVAFDVFEADKTLNSRPQGYRIRIDAEGQRALARTLPPELYDLFRGTVSTTATSGRFLTPGLLPAPGRKPDSWRSADSVDDGAQGGWGRKRQSTHPARDPDVRDRRPCPFRSRIRSLRIDQRWQGRSAFPVRWSCVDM